MKSFLLITVGILLLGLAGCDLPDGGKPNYPDCSDCPEATEATEPSAALPVTLRQKNWIGRKGAGSCYHAATHDVLFGQDMPEMAEWWKQTYGDGEWTHKLIKKMQQANLRVAFTDDGNETFLQWCSMTGRPAAITWRGLNSPSGHAITFNGFYRGQAYITNNNNPEQMECLPKAVFLRIWRRSGGDAVSVIHTPLAPKPILRKGVRR